MPKHLYLFRHAEAITKSVKQHDKERELTTNGVSESVQVAGQFLKTALPIDVIFCSTADRARQTALFAMDTMALDSQIIKYEDELYDASARTFFNFVTGLDNGLQHVMCVGHNPPITYLAEYLTKEAIGDIVTGGMVVIKFSTNSWSELSEGNGELLHYFQPLQRD